MDAPKADSSELQPITDEVGHSANRSVHTEPARGKFRWLAVSSGLLLIILITIGTILAVVRRPSSISQLVVRTVPPGAEITLDSRQLGPSPIKLEGVSVGAHRLTITKDGFEPISEDITISGSDPVERWLKPILDAGGLSAEEQIKQYTTSADEAFKNGDYCMPYDSSALGYADKILQLEPSNQFAKDMRETVRRALYRGALDASQRGNLALAQDYYAALVERYPEDDEAKAAAVKLESQLAARKGEVRDLVRTAQEAFRAGDLNEDERSAYFYAKQALARDRQNVPAKEILNSVKERLLTAGDSAWARGEFDLALKNLEQASRLFPEDKALRPHIRDLEARRNGENRGTRDPAARRVQGLAEYGRGEFAEAISDLKYSIESGQGAPGPEVYFALGRSYQMLHQLDYAEHYLLRVTGSTSEAHPSAIAALGDIALERGDQPTALRQYKRALSLGGSTLYPAADLEDKIARIEVRTQQEKSPEPAPISVQVKHQHGGILKGSCSGTLTVNSTGVRFDGTEHTFASNLVTVGVSVSGNEMTIKLPNRSEKFSLSHGDAERFMNALTRFQGEASKN